MSNPIEQVEDKVEEQTGKTISPWRETWREFRRNRIALVGMIIVLFFIFLAIFATFLAKEGINEQVMTDRLQPRSEEHTSELQSRGHRVCRLLLEKKKKKTDRKSHGKKRATEKKNTSH